MANGLSWLLLCTLVMMYAKGGLTSSQFLSDFSVSIVDKQLSSTVSTPTSSTPTSSTPSSSTPTSSTPTSSTPTSSTPTSSTPTSSTPTSSTPTSSTPTSSTPTSSTPTSSTPTSSTPTSSTPTSSTPTSSTPTSSTPTSSTPRTSSTTSNYPHGLRARSFRIIPRQDLIFSTDPVVERGTAGKYDRRHGDVEINEDGTYFFMIHRVGVSTTNLPLLLEVNNATNDYVTIAEILDNGEGSIVTANVLAELKRGNRVSIHTQGSEVIGDENQPFIYTMFLLNHVPITSFPVVRQSAFSVTGLANLSVAESVVDDYEAPAVNIGDGFDSLTGVFTAPFGGLYVFNLAITFTPKGPGIGRGVVALHVNGETVAQVTGRVLIEGMAFRYAPPPSPPSQNSAITVAQNLNQGDEVILRNVIATEILEGNVMFVGYLLS